MPPAVILAAGESSRFWPLSTHGHKSLHRLAGKAVIEHTVESLAAAGVTDIVVVQSPIARAAHFPHRTVADQLGDGRRYGATIRYIDQVEPLGAADAILLATPHLRDDFFVVNAEHVNAGTIARELAAAKPGSAAVAAAHEVEETWLYGVFSLAGDRLKNLVEKPEPGTEPSRLCNMGLYLAGQDYLELVRQEPRRDPVANLRALVKLAGRTAVRIHQTAEPFFPLKYPWHLFAMASCLAPDGYRGDNLDIAADAEIGPGCLIENDCVIGTGVRLEQCLVGAGSRIGTTMRDTIVGAAVTIEAGAVIEDTPLEAGAVSVDIKGHSINTGLLRLGATIGQGTTVRAGATVAAGLLLGAESEVPKRLSLRGNLGDRAVAGTG